MHVFVYGGGQGSTLGIFLQAHLFSQTRFLTKQALLAGQEASGSCLSPLPLRQYHKHVPPCPFPLYLGSRN